MTAATLGGVTVSMYSRADYRVSTEPRLQPFYDVLLTVDWPDQEALLRWIIGAPTAEIVAWAEQAEADLLGEAMAMFGERAA